MNKTLAAKKLFSVKFKLAPSSSSLGKTPYGGRVISEIIGGEFEGETIKGKVLHGADWRLQRNDASVEMNVRVVLKTQDEAIIAMTYRGFRHGDPDAMARIERGEMVDASLYTMEIAPFFETGVEKYSWLNHAICIGYGERHPDGPTYDIYQLGPVIER